ncbi:hypothetical protein BJY04DRAFT_188335 [Aspergillus karnatakaensis]|uniref:FAD-dependent oxidoreductase n=1 Tax=Aspergillus karnatakaensis TaxID=1810916 RepID=UPI003CCD1F08
MATPEDPILIVGAGLVGLTLGQALKQKGIPFQIYERDANPSSRTQGWAITIHWALSYLESLLPESTLTKIQDAQVDPAIAKNDTGNFLFLNLESGDVKFRIPPSKRWRVNREGLRRALLSGIEDNVIWGCDIESISFDNADGKPRVELKDSDGRKRFSEPGSLLIGVEGSKSPTRRFLCPDAYRNSPLPIRFTGVAVDLSPEQAAPLRALDPLLFQGCHPKTGVYLWFSILETPELGKRDDYRVQICISWPVKGPGDEVHGSDAERLANMKQRAEGFVAPLYNAVQRIPDGTPVVEVSLADWEGQLWDNRGGRVTLAGDAAHAMTMYRGEGANHGLLDTLHLVAAIEKIYAGGDAKAAMDEYESEMRKRTQQAVQLSRRACFEAHNWDELNENCAILSRRKLD